MFLNKPLWGWLSSLSSGKNLNSPRLVTLGYFSWVVLEVLHTESAFLK